MTQPHLGRSTLTPHERRERVLAALTDRDGNPKPWYAAEEIGYSPFLRDVSLRQIVAALCWLRDRGIVQHSGGVEWKLTALGLEKTRTGL